MPVDPQTPALPPALDPASSNSPAGSSPTQTFAADQSNTIEQTPGPALGGFGRYQLLRSVGQGGMGEVYLAFDTQLERQVALKIPRFANDAQAQHTRFLREARAAAALQHTGICPVFDVGEWDGRPYLTMGFVDGPSLSQELHRRGPFSLGEAAALVRDIAHAMHHAHQQGILHRDLKPANILLDAGQRPVVTDFGLAFRFDADASQRLTKEGLIVGTPAYMPPEQLNGQEMTPAADVYSLGVVLYELLTGKVPFDGSLGKLIAQIESTPAPAPSIHRPDIEPSLESICLRALEKNPARRFATMDQFAAALDGYAQGRPEEKASTITEIIQAPRSRRLLKMVVILCLVMVAAVGTAAWLWKAPAEEQGWTIADGSWSDNPVLAHLTDPRVLKATFLEHMRKPILKVDHVMQPGLPAFISRSTLPPGLLKTHSGPLFHQITGSGLGHQVDVTDQPTQGVQVSNFGVGDLTIQGPYLTFLGNVSDQAHFYIMGGPVFSLLVPINSGPGSPHVEFLGTHVLLPKSTKPIIDRTEATSLEISRLRNPSLTHKIRIQYPSTAYYIFTVPEVQIIPGDNKERAEKFPDVHQLFELDRERNLTARTITNSQLQRALEEWKGKKQP